MASADEEQQITEILANTSKDAQSVLAEVLRLEQEKLHMKNPMGIIDDIVSNVKAAIK